MKLSAFVIYDSTVEAYLPPIFMRSAGEAKRAITEALRDPGHDFCKYPQDYTLFQCGYFDQDTGIFDSIPLKSIGCLINFVQVKPELVVQEEKEDQTSVAEQQAKI